MPHPDEERLALAALPAEPPDPDLAAHLAACAQCRQQVAVLRRTVELARTGARTVTPPARVWQAITDELGADALDTDELDGAGAPEGPDEPGTAPAPAAPVAASPGASAAATPVTDGPPRSRGTRPGGNRRRRVLVPVVAALAGLAAGLAIGIAVAAPAAAPEPTVVAQLRPVGPLDPGAVGSVDAVAHDGVQDLVVQVRGVTDTAGGQYLEAWMMDPSGTRLLSLGALTRTADGSYRGEFTVPADLPTAAFTVVDISAERWDGNPTHSTISILRGSTT